MTAGTTARPGNLGFDWNIHAEHGILLRMSKVITSLPIGERVGIAFSGGLDT